MKPPPFEYRAPRTPDEAIAMLAEHGDGAKALAGGQSLVPILNFRLAHPTVLVDLNGVAGLDRIGHDAATDEVVFGAMVRQIDAERSPLIKARCSLLVEALGYIGHRAIRNRGTIGGSLAHADPAAEIPLILAALDGRAKVAGPRGERWLSAADLYISYLMTALEPDELLVEARFPALRSGQRWGFEEFSRRHGDFAIVATAVVLGIDSDGTIERPAVAVAGGGPTPIRAGDAELALLGRRPTERLLAEAAALAAAACEAEADIHASAEYRRALIATLVERALARAVRPAEPQGDGAR